MFKNSLLVILPLGLFASCAHIRPTAETEDELTPKETVVTFTKEEQRKQMNSLIEQGTFEQNETFLRNIKNEKVKFWINYFTQRDRERFMRYLSNGEKYRHIIENVLEDHGLPKELYFVGLIESGYNLTARSHAQAVGPWQFISSTAKRYGLKVSSAVDERRSIVKSTKAAALFFQDLYNIFGTWELALSAYNAGEYGIIRRIRGAKTRDYYELSEMKKLPKETRHYIPKIIAAMEIVKNPRRYSLTIPTNSDQDFHSLKKVNIDKQVSLRTLASLSGVSLETLRKVNSDLKENVIPYQRGGYDLYVPSIFQKKISGLYLPELKTRTQTYKVKRGDNLYSIARQHGMSFKNLMAMNNLKRKSRIYPGQELKLSYTEKIVKKNSPPDFTKYKVQRGDNLYSIARQNNTTVSEIMDLNYLKRRTIYVGQNLKLPYINKIFYVVKKGDYLEKIAQTYSISIADLKRINALNNSKIFPGQRLVVKFN